MGAEKRSRARRAASSGDRRNGWNPEVSGASHRLDAAVGAESVTLCHRSAAGARAPGLRIVLCSHDTMGLGHMRRTLLISRALAESQLQANILMIAGAAEAKLFHMPARVDCVTLPALRKQSDGRYEARSLGLTLPEIGSLRASTICAAVEAFSPDVMIVDNLPRGAIGELNTTLRRLRAKGHTRCVLGLRDVLDEPRAVRREWLERANDDAVAEFYDAIWIYGDPRVFDTVHDYGWSDDTMRKARYTGYLDRSTAPSNGMAGVTAGLNLSDRRLFLCMAGGGQDGAALMLALLRSELPPDSHCLAVTGPFMPVETKQALAVRAARDARFDMVEFLPEPTCLIERAEGVIAMGGYNTVSEILSFQKPALIVPRVEPRQEQLIRARRMQELGLLDMLHPRDLTPDALSAWLARGWRKPANALEVIDFKGLSRLPAFVSDVLDVPTPRKDARTRLTADTVKEPLQ